ncbi:MFS polyamine transporter [Artomyces pyxidatus]|uniref:MFS polyamine transporter n=1 Tax=Artomyces pyxidatus TaxID=48021 RepID=A0ACB8SS74_9AGAM|nr:MFS polyamine transporter [Artomyces pyxidatus]
MKESPPAGLDGIRASPIAGLDDDRESFQRTITNEKSSIAGLDDLESFQPTIIGDTQSAKTNDDNVLIVDWDGPDDPENPRNWSSGQKWGATVIVSVFTFISPVSSSMIAPSSEQLAHDFGVTNSAIVAMFTSVFVLAYAVGPLFLGPLSEAFGRARILQLSNLWYLVWNLSCGFTQNTGQLLAFRFLAGLGGSAPFAIGGAVIGDLFSPDQRGQAIAIYSLAPNLGPVIGPIAGAWVAQNTTWRWVFWSTTIADAIVQILGTVFLKETYAPTLLERKAERIRRSMDEEKVKHTEVRTVFQSNNLNFKAFLARALVRPFSLFIHEPIVQLLGLYMAFLYGLLYLFITTIPSMFQDIYHQRVGASGLHYTAFGVGLIGGVQLNALVMNRVYMYFKGKNGGVGRPEFRLPNIIPGTILLPIGLFLTGWTARSEIHWIVPDIGISFVGAGIILTFQSIQTYVIDAFTMHAASALAVVTFFRSMAGFGFPLFAQPMYGALGYGRGNTVLAIVAVVFGYPAPWLLWVYGERIRDWSRYARKAAL